MAAALEERVPEDSIDDITWFADSQIFFSVSYLVRVYDVCDIHSVVMVVGAGRGPLVEASLKAAKATQRKIRIYAVEKNPGAVNT